MAKIEKSAAEWQAQLSDIQYQVTRQKGTEPVFTGKYWDTKTKGIYECICCGNPLFNSATKYDSGTGWPSFWQPLAADAVENRDDHSLLRRRTEVICTACDAHLGHVFSDGPEPSRQRYCINSASLRLKPASDD